MTATLRLVDPPPPPAGPKSEPWMENAACVGKPLSMFFDYRNDERAGDRILELLRERPMTTVELQDALGYRQNTIASWTGRLRSQGSITWSYKPGTRQWLYQICGGEPSP